MAGLRTRGTQHQEKKVLHAKGPQNAPGGRKKYGGKQKEGRALNQNLHLEKQPHTPLIELGGKKGRILSRLIAKKRKRTEECRSSF